MCNKPRAISREEADTVLQPYKGSFLHSTSPFPFPHVLDNHCISWYVRRHGRFRPIFKRCFKSGPNLNSRLVRISRFEFEHYRIMVRALLGLLLIQSIFGTGRSGFVGTFIQWIGSHGHLRMIIIIALLRTSPFCPDAG